MSDDKKLTGIVDWFNVAKGYGFITQDSGEADMFVHYSDIILEGFRLLKKGQRVSYTTRLNNVGKLVAAEVVVLK